MSLSPSGNCLSCGSACGLELLLPHLAGVVVEQVDQLPGLVCIWARARSPGGTCPRCGVASARVHGRYERRLADGAAGGRPVVICLTVRRLVCGNPGCAAVTFAEQVDGCPAATCDGAAAAGAAGRDRAGTGGPGGGTAGGRLGLPCGRSRCCAWSRPARTRGGAAPPVLGVDDFALRKGRVYGTVLVNLGTAEAIDLLPDREAGTLQAWLSAHPGAAVICRDRAGAYADGARDGAPDAIQVADRWHLWHNLGEYVEKAVAAHRACLTGSGGAPASPGSADAGPGPPPTEPEGLHDVCGRERRLVARTRDRHAAVHGLLAAGHSQRDAATWAWPQHRAPVRRRRQPEELLVKATSRAARLDRYKPYLHQRWNEGITNATAAAAELQARDTRQLRPSSAPTYSPSAPSPPPRPGAPVAPRRAR